MFSIKRNLYISIIGDSLSGPPLIHPPSGSLSTTLLLYNVCSLFLCPSPFPFIHLSLAHRLLPSQVFSEAITTLQP